MAIQRDIHIGSDLRAYWHKMPNGQYGGVRFLYSRQTSRDLRNAYTGQFLTLLHLKASVGIITPGPYCCEDEASLVFGRNLTPKALESYLKTYEGLENYWISPHQASHSRAGDGRARLYVGVKALDFHSLFPGAEGKSIQMTGFIWGLYDTESCIDFVKLGMSWAEVCQRLPVVGICSEEKDASCSPKDKSTVSDQGSSQEGGSCLEGRDDSPGVCAESGVLQPSI